MKIVIDCRFWGEKDTGLGRYTKNLVENILELDHNNKYYLIFRKKTALLPKNNNFSPIFTDINNYSLKEQIELPFIINKIKPDLVHFPHFNVPILYKEKYILTIHDLIKHESRGVDTTTKHPLVYFLKYYGYKWIISKAIKNAGKILTPSYWVKKQILKYYSIPKDKIKVIYEGVDQKYKIPQPKAGPPWAENNKNQKDDNILDKYNIHKPFLIYTGNAYPHKNLRRLLLAVKIINQNRTNKIQLVISSARDVFSIRLQKEINNFKVNQYIKILGFIPDNDLSYIYSEALAFITPSLMEGFGLPALEAMSSGCPVLCSNIEVFKEIYGNTPIYFNPENIEDIVEKINELSVLTESERKKLIKAGKIQASKYSWHKCSQETLKIYESCFSI